MLFQDISHLRMQSPFGRERIIHRRVLAQGAGVHGVFEVIRAVPEYTCAAFLSQVGKRTEVFARFATLGGGRGAADSRRDVRDFSVKFYTEEGIYDLLGNNTPVFFSRAATARPAVDHTQPYHPPANPGDLKLQWDFWVRSPESLHHLGLLFSDRGTPASYRAMHGFGGYTYMWYNERKEYVWVKYHWLCNQPIRNFTGPEAEAVGRSDPDYGVRDLRDAIARGAYPSWTLNVQIMSVEEAEHFRFDPFDVTKVWYHGEFPLIPVGRLVLNRNPEDYFSEWEQAAFSPGNLVPGIALSPDRVLQSRLSGGSALCPAYYPLGGPLPPDDRAIPPRVDLKDPGPRRPQNFEQPGVFYGRVLDDPGRSRLCDNLAASLEGIERNLQYRETAFFTLASPEWGGEMAKRLRLDFGTVQRIADMIRVP
jgi:catalase